MNDDEFVDAVIELNDAQVETIEKTDDAVAVNASAELDEKENQDGNLREFFAQPASNFKGDGIRKLYPVVASLSEGQIAGIQFMNLQELIDAGLNNIENMEQEMLKDIDTASVYEGVNREIFEKGAVALTSAALRQEALTKDNAPNATTKTRNIGIVLAAAGAVTLAGAWSTNYLRTCFKNLLNSIDNLKVANWSLGYQNWSKTATTTKGSQLLFSYFLISDKASFCTGGHYLCDGGLVCQ